MIFSIFYFIFSIKSISFTRETQINVSVSNRAFCYEYKQGDKGIELTPILHKYLLYLFKPQKNNQSRIKFISEYDFSFYEEYILFIVSRV